MSDVLCKDEIINHLSSPEKFKISVFSDIDSTNSHLKTLAKHGAEIGTVIIADSQSNGHGRYERKFHSPKNSGIYMSVLLKPELTADKSVLITAAAAVAICDAIFSLTSKKTQIKWVNDILLNGKKLCGILTEGSLNTQSHKLDWAVLGIGINVYIPKEDFNQEIKDIAISLLNNRKENFRNLLCAEILNNLSTHIENLKDKTFLEKYKEYSCLKNKKINIIKDGLSEPATVLEIDDDCRLVVKRPNGEKEILVSGEISIKV